MLQFKGKGVYSAIAIGAASLFKRQQVQLSRRHIEDTQDEIRRLESAKQKAISQLSQIYEKAVGEVGEKDAQIFEIHIMMLEDDDYNESIQNIITTESVDAQYAVAVTAENFSQMFAQMDDAYMQARAADVKDISNRLIACLGEQADSVDGGTEKIIVFADDLAPSETMSLDKDRVLAFVTAGGSPNSHTAILARSLNIPAVIGAGEEVLRCVSDGQTVVVNGHTGEITIDPDERFIAMARAEQQQDIRSMALLQELKGKQNVTLDGTRVNVFANIQGVDEIDAALDQFVDTHHEAVLRLIEMSVRSAHANGAWIGICGELAADMWN